MSLAGLPDVLESGSRGRVGWRLRDGVAVMGRGCFDFEHIKGAGGVPRCKGLPEES